jgi:hypothetical protein
MRRSKQRQSALSFRHFYHRTISESKCKEYKITLFVISLAHNVMATEIVLAILDHMQLDTTAFKKLKTCCTQARLSQFCMQANISTYSDRWCIGYTSSIEDLRDFLKNLNPSWKAAILYYLASGYFITQTHAVEAKRKWRHGKGQRRQKPSKRIHTRRKWRTALCPTSWYTFSR